MSDDKAAEPNDSSGPDLGRVAATAAAGALGLVLGGPLGAAGGIGLAEGAQKIYRDQQGKDSKEQ